MVFKHMATATTIDEKAAFTYHHTEARRRRAEARRRAVRASHNVPQREWFWWLRIASPMCERVMLNLLWVFALFCLFLIVCLLIALSYITLFVLGAVLIVALVVGGKTLLRTLADFMKDTLREVSTMCRELFQDPSLERLFDMAWRYLNR
ncbi:hypothetical protein MRX96_013600 [Rhipicephalus microplus]